MYSIKSTSVLLTLFILQAFGLSLADEILTKSKIYEVPEGGRVVLDCELKDNPNETRTLWTKIVDEKKDTIYVGTYRYTKDKHFGKRFENNSIEIVNANKDDEGMYECMLTIDNNSGIFNTVVHQLVIQYKPIIKDASPQLISIVENADVTISCNAEGVPKPSYTWERKGEWPKNFNKEASSNTFKAEPNLSGAYFCNASNILGSVTNTFNVDVRFAPEVSISETVAGDQPNIRNVICLVRSNPKPESINLYKVGAGVTAREEAVIEDENNPILTKYTRIFTVHDEKDYGEYTCTARNVYGETRKSHNVTMERPKPEKVHLIDFPENGVMTDDSELEWYLKSPYDINRFDVVVSKVTQSTPKLSKSLIKAVEVKPRQTEDYEFKGSFRFDELETDNTYTILIQAVNAYDQKSEVEVDVHLQKSSSSSANQSLICILLILAINLYHFGSIRLH